MCSALQDSTRYCKTNCQSSFVLAVRFVIICAILLLWNALKRSGTYVQGRGGAATMHQGKCLRTRNSFRQWDHALNAQIFVRSVCLCLTLFGPLANFWLCDLRFTVRNNSIGRFNRTHWSRLDYVAIHFIIWLRQVLSVRIIFSISLKDWQIGGHKVDSAGRGFETSKLKAEWRYVLRVAYCSVFRR